MVWDELFMRITNQLTCYSMPSDQFDTVYTGGNSKGTIPWIDFVWNYVTFKLHVVLYNAAAEKPSIFLDFGTESHTFNQMFSFF